MFCEKCGTEIPRGAKFCEKCGSQVEPDIQESKGDSSHKKWIFGGIIGGIVVVAVVVAVLFATGILGAKDDVIQASTDGGMQSDAGGSETGIQTAEEQTESTEQTDQTEQPTAEPLITPSPAPEPTENPVESNGSEEPTGEDGSDYSENTRDLADARTPEETYKQYIETFVEAVNTGNTDGLSEVLSGKVHKQQCDLIENYYSRGIQEELQSYSITSTKQLNDSCIKVNVKETIKVFYEDGSSKVIKQKYNYTCKNINSVWVITGMKETK